jgi:putative transposase
VIKQNVSAMCDVLNINRSTYYYESKPQVIDNSVEEAVVKLFESNRSVYGTRKIKMEPKKLDMIVSRRRIGRLMKKTSWFPYTPWPNISLIKLRARKPI